MDLCNEFPIPPWAPYLYQPKGAERPKRVDSFLAEWMSQSVGLVRAAFPALDYTYSMCDESSTWPQPDVSMLDVLEPHVRMSHPETRDYDERIGYSFEKSDPIAFDNVLANGREEYERDLER